MRPGNKGRKWRPCGQFSEARKERRNDNREKGRAAQLCLQRKTAVTGKAGPPAVHACLPPSGRIRPPSHPRCGGEKRPPAPTGGKTCQREKALAGHGITNVHRFFIHHLSKTAVARQFHICRMDMKCLCGKLLSYQLYTRPCHAIRCCLDCMLKRTMVTAKR